MAETDHERFVTGLIDRQQLSNQNQCRQKARDVYNACVSHIDEIEKAKQGHCVTWAIGGAAAGTLISKSPLGTAIGGGISLAGCFLVDWLDSAFYAGKAGCAMEAQRIFDLCMTDPD